MSNDLDKELGDAMGDAPKAASTSKKTLAGPVPAPAAEPVKVYAEPKPESAQEAYLRGKLDALTELLAEERSAKTKVAKAHAVAREAIDDKDIEYVEFTVNLPVQAQNIRLDGTEYYHGYTYKVPRDRALSMLDIQAMAWRHDEQVRGYRPHAGGMKTGGVHINGNGQQMSSPVF